MEFVIHRRKENKTQWLNSEGKWTSKAKEAGQFNKRTANKKANLLNAKTFDYDAIKRLADSEKEWDIFIVNDYEEFIEIENLNKNIKRCIAYETNDLMLKTKMYFYWIGE